MVKCDLVISLDENLILFDLLLLLCYFTLLLVSNKCPASAVKNSLCISIDGVDGVDKDSGR